MRLQSMHLTLIRDQDNGDMSLGKWCHGDFDICESLERPWLKSEDGRAGVPFESCIPAGVYGLEPYTSDHFKDEEGNPLQTFYFENEELGVFSHKDQMLKYGKPGDRYGISIHAANWPYQLQGCNAPGTYRREDGVGSSQKALTKLLDMLRQDPINTVEIKYARAD